MRYVKENLEKTREIWEELSKIRSDSSDSIRLDNGQTILDIHKKLAESEQESESDKNLYYWNFERNQINSPCYELEFNNNKVVICSKLADLPLELRAICIDNVARIYSERLLKLGEKSHKLYENDPEKAKEWKELKEKKLLIQMMKEYRNDHILSLVLGNIKGNKSLLGSMGVVHGIGDRKILETVGYDGITKTPPSSIPTNFSLEFELSSAAKDKLFDIKEKQVSELTRLCSFVNNQSDDKNDSLRVLLSIYASIPPVVQKAYEIKFFEFNSKKYLHDSLISLGYPIFIGGYNTRSTLGIQRKPLGEYFRENESLLIPQFLDFDSTVEIGYKFEKMLRRS